MQYLLQPDIAFIMSSSTSAWLLSPLECSPQKQNGRTLRFCFWGWIIWKMYNKKIIEFGFRMISWIIKTLCLCASADNTDLGFDNSWYHAQPHPIIVYYCILRQNSSEKRSRNKSVSTCIYYSITRAYNKNVSLFQLRRSPRRAWNRPKNTRYHSVLMQNKTETENSGKHEILIWRHSKIIVKSF